MRTLRDRPDIFGRPCAHRGSVHEEGKRERRPPAAKLISDRIAELGDWRGETLARMRKLIHEAVPAVEETWKWRGVPVWEHDGIICTGETYKAVVKLTFAKGASADDPAKLFARSPRFAFEESCTLA